MKYIVVLFALLTSCKYTINNFHKEYQAHGYNNANNLNYDRFIRSCYMNLELQRDGRYFINMNTEGSSLGNYKMNDSVITLYNDFTSDSIHFGIDAAIFRFKEINYIQCDADINRPDSFILFYGEFMSKDSITRIHLCQHPYSVIYAGNRYESWDNSKGSSRWTGWSYDPNSQAQFGRICGFDSIELIDSFIKIDKKFPLDNINDIFKIYFKQKECGYHRAFYYDSLKFIIMPNYGLKLTEIDGNKINSDQFKNTFLYRRAFDERAINALSDTFYTVPKRHFTYNLSKRRLSNNPTKSIDKKTGIPYLLSL
jgi:hypothetical protein